jgi:hypothetical protein
MSFGGRPYEAFDWFKPWRHHVVAREPEEEGGNVMGCAQYLDLALEHRSLVRIGTSFKGRTNPFIFPLSLDSSFLLSLSSLYNTESLFTVLYGHPVTLCQLNYP